MKTIFFHLFYLDIEEGLKLLYELLITPKHLLLVFQSYSDSYNES